MNKLIESYLNSIEPEMDSMIQIIMEGGAFGHLAHPFENLHMTFGELRTFVDYLLSGKAVAYEKIDGQQISFSWKNGQLIAARNKSHIKNFGENGLTVNTIKDFIGKSGSVPSNVINAFYQAMVDIESALKNVPTAELENIFKNGKFFMNAELVAMETKNVISYYKDYIVFHGLIEYDEAGNAMGIQLREPAEKLEKILKLKNATQQSKFTIRDSNRIALKNFKELPEQRREFQSQIDRLQGNLPDEASLIKSQELWWRNFILEKARHFGYHIDENVLEMLIGRWARLEKSLNTIPKICSRIDNEKFKSWVKTYDSKDYQRQYDINLFDHEMFFLRLGATILSNASGFLTASPDKSVADLSLEIKKAAEQIKNAKDLENIKKLKYELERFNAIGKDKIVGSEGVVLPYQNKLYKLTGIFTPIHRILSLITYKKPVAGPQSLTEGGNAVFTNSSLDRKYLENTIAHAFEIWSIADVNYEIVGSKNKPTMNDIDVAVEFSELAKKIGAEEGNREDFWLKANGYFSKNVPEEISERPAFKLNKGLDQIHLSAPIVGVPGKFVQIDLMLGNVGWMKDALSGSENSKYKSVYRNLLLVSILTHSKEATSRAGIYKKYQINWKKGLQSVDVKDTGGKLEKGSPTGVFSNMDDVSRFLFGSDVRFSDINTFEKLYNRMDSPQFRYKQKREDILNTFKSDLERLKLPIPPEI